MASSAVTWLDYDSVSSRLGVSVGKVRQLVQERALLARRIDGSWAIPEPFLLEGGVVSDVRGTATLLIDGGFSDDQALTWFLEENDALGVAPIEAIRHGRKTEVRRLAQSLAL